MSIICQVCEQRLPKTAKMCPNCGNRQDFIAEQSQPNIMSNSEGFVETETQPIPTQNLQNNIQSTNFAELNYTRASQDQSQFQEVQPSYHSQATAQTNHVPIDVYQQPLTNASFTTIREPVNNPLATNITTQALHNPPNLMPTMVNNSAVSLPPVPRRPANTMLYAGFMRRFWAYLFDTIFILVVLGAIWQPLLDSGYISSSNQDMVASLLIMILYLLYSAFFTSRGRQATFGKMIFGLWVYDMQGQRLGFWHAFIREVVKSIFMPLAVVMWFTERKQTFHDLIVRTVVLFDPD